MLKSGKMVCIMEYFLHGAIVERLCIWGGGRGLYNSGITIWIYTLTSYKQHVLQTVNQLQV